MSILNPRRCLKYLPGNLATWVQPSISSQYDHPERWWIRVTRKSGKMSPPERTILAFWCSDQAFSEFLRLYERRVKRLVETGVKVAVNPDVTICWDDNKELARRLLVRQLKYGLWMQRLGMTVLPNLPLLHPCYAEELYAELLPREVPLAAQIQTCTRPQYGTRDYYGLAKTVECLETVERVTSSPQLLLYGSRSIYNIIESQFSKPEILRFVQSFSDVLNRGTHQLS